jgi:hypothetical protein
MGIQFLLTVFSSAAVSTVLTGLLLWLLKNLISERLKGAIRFEYDEKLKRVDMELTRLSEDRTRKLERLLKHYERQIEEFYGPLWNLVHQLYVGNETKERLERRLNAEQRTTVDRYYHETHFGPIHEEIRQIIKTRLYLVDGGAMPDSFYEYLRHASQERDQRELAEQQHIDTSFLKGVPWPEEFHQEIKRGFDTAMKNYEDCLDGIKSAFGTGA